MEKVVLLLREKKNMCQNQIAKKLYTSFGCSEDKAYKIDWLSIYVSFHMCCCNCFVNTEWIEFEKKSVAGERRHIVIIIMVRLLQAKVG